MNRRVNCFFFFLMMMLSAGTIFPQNPPIEPGVSQTLARWRAARYSDVRYKLNLTLEKRSPVLKGAIEISVKLKNQGEKLSSDDAQIILDWRKIRGMEDLSKVANVSLNGRQVKFEEINEHLVFREGVQAGENTIKLDFTSPIATSGAALTRYVDREDGAEYIYSLFVPSDASTAFPVFDQPDLKARFQLDLSFPIGWKAVSNSLAQIIERPMCENIERCLQTYSFSETKPISTYVFAFAAGEFAEIYEQDAEKLSGKKTSTAPLNIPTETISRIYVRKSQVDKFKPHAAEVFRLNGEAVKFLESYFDYKFPFPKYDLVLIPEFPFGGMEHAGATFLRESSIVFPSEPTANDFISRANLIFHEAAHQWFGDTVTMRWFDDLWLKEGFAEFTAYKTLEKVLPQYNAWKAFYERNKPLAYLTDSTRGTTPIYQEIPNLSAAKSAYGNIVYRKAPSFLRQAEFYLGEDKFQQAVRAFLKKHQFANAEWTDLVKEFEAASGEDLKDFSDFWVKKPGAVVTLGIGNCNPKKNADQSLTCGFASRASAANDLEKKDSISVSAGIPIKSSDLLQAKLNVLFRFSNGETRVAKVKIGEFVYSARSKPLISFVADSKTGNQPELIFPNYQDYGYGIFLLDERSRDYILKNIQNEKDDFFRSMMWGALWDSVREAELDPRDYVELAIKNISIERDELTIQTILSRVSTAMNYYLSDAERERLAPQLENLLIEKMRNAPTLGQRVTFYRAFLNVASSINARNVLKEMLKSGSPGVSAGGKSANDLNAGNKPDSRPASAPFPLKTKDKFDILTRLWVLGEDALPLLRELAQTERSDDARRYAYGAQAAIPTAQNKKEYFDDFVSNPAIPESWIEAAFGPFNTIRQADLTLPYLEKALAELPALKRNRKIFFVNGWLAAFIGGQRDERALQIVNRFLADNPNLDRDLRLKILENVDIVERAVKIRAKYGS